MSNLYKIQYYQSNKLEKAFLRGNAIRFFYHYYKEYINLISVALACSKASE